MVDFFKTEELDVAKKQRKKVLIWFFVVLGVYLLSSLAVLFWYLTLPYMSETIKWVKVVQYSLVAIFVIFAFLYLGIPFRRINKYYKMLRNMVTGLRETSTGSFFEYDESIQTKDGVEFKAIVFLEWNKYKNDFFERRVLVYAEKDFPVFEKNENVRYITQGNKLCSYEILE